ncbi:MAG: ArsR/SmtB family transcription factor [Thiohalocapsa sp.]
MRWTSARRSALTCSLPPTASSGISSRRRHKQPDDAGGGAVKRRSGEAPAPARRPAARTAGVLPAPGLNSGAPPTPIGADSGARLDAIFAALSDPIRRGIIARLTQGSCSVSELGMPFAVSAPAISRHLGVLEQCGLIARWKTGRVHYCRLLGPPLQQAAAWIEQHQAFWERQLDALADYLDAEHRDREEERCDRPPQGSQEP